MLKLDIWLKKNKQTWILLSVEAEFQMGYLTTFDKLNMTEWNSSLTFFIMANLIECSSDWLFSLLIALLISF